MSNNPTGNWGINFPGMHDEAFVAEVAKELDELLMWEAIMCAQEQRELAQLYNDRPPEKCIDGVGPQILAITPTAFIHYKAVEKLDFSNPRDIQYLINRHPHMRVRGPQTTRIQSGYRGPEVRSQKSEVSKTAAESGSSLQAETRGAVRSTTKFSNN